MRIANHVNGLHSGGATHPSRRKWPSVFYLFIYFFLLLIPVC